MKKAIRKLSKLNKMRGVNPMSDAFANRVTRPGAFGLRHCAQCDQIYSTNAAESLRGGTKEAV